MTPPAAAARVAVAKPSHSVRPGSLTWTWVSTSPGSSTSSSSRSRTRRGAQAGLVRLDGDDPPVGDPDAAGHLAGGGDGAPGAQHQVEVGHVAVLSSVRTGPRRRGRGVRVGEPVRGQPRGEALEQRAGLGHAPRRVGLDVGQRVAAQDPGGQQLLGGQQAAAGDGDGGYAGAAGRGGHPGRSLAVQGLLVQRPLPRHHQPAARQPVVEAGRARAPARCRAGRWRRARRAPRTRPRRRRRRPERRPPGARAGRRPLRWRRRPPRTAGPAPPRAARRRRGWRPSAARRPRPRPAGRAAGCPRRWPARSPPRERRAAARSGRPGRAGRGRPRRRAASPRARRGTVAPSAVSMPGAAVGAGAAADPDDEPVAARVQRGPDDLAEPAAGRRAAAPAGRRAAGAGRTRRPSRRPRARPARRTPVSTGSPSGPATRTGTRGVPGAHRRVERPVTAVGDREPSRPRPPAPAAASPADTCAATSTAVSEPLNLSGATRTCTARRVRRLSRAGDGGGRVPGVGGQLLELDHAVDLGAHRDVGDPLQDDLDHDRHPELDHQLLRLSPARAGSPPGPPPASPCSPAPRRP